MTTPDTTQETRIGRDWPRSVGIPLAADLVASYRQAHGEGPAHA